jgi:putative ABC transport system permease protein
VIRRTRAWILRVAGMLTRGRRQREFDDELQAHLAMHIDDNIRAGMTPEHARRVAVIALGGVESVREAYQDRLGVPVLASLGQDARFAVRILSRSPGVSIFAITAIGIGIGINATVFSLANAVLVKPLPVKDGDSLMFVGTVSMSRPGDFDGLSWPDFIDLRARVRSLASLAASSSTAADMSDGIGFAEPLRGEEVTVNAFAVMGVQPVLGREFSEADAQPGTAPVVLLSARTWKARYGSDPNIVGRVVRVNAMPTTIVGVMADAPLINEGNTGLWLPFQPDERWKDRGRRRLSVYARLASGYAPGAADAEVAAHGAALAREYPDTNRNVQFVARDFRAFSLPERVRMMFLVMLGAVGFVLLVACANVANLLLARAAGRAREIAIRSAIGASRWRVIRQLLVESLLLSSVGGFLGLALAIWGVQAFDAALVDSERPLWLNFSVDFTVLAYLAAITIGTGVIFGLAPAWRLAKLDTTSALKEGSAGGGRRRIRVVMSSLVIAEMTLAVVLLAGAGVMIRSFLNVYTTPVGFDKQNLLTMRLNTARYYDQVEARKVLLGKVVENLGAVPGVRSVAVTTGMPAGGSLTELPVQLGGTPSANLALSVVVGVVGDYAESIGAPLRAGRPLNTADWGSPIGTTAVVNESFAARAWPAEDPLEKQFRFVIDGKPQPWLTVVGVVGDFAQRERVIHQPLAYVPYAHLPNADVSVVIRTAVPPATLIEPVRRAMRTLDPDLPVIELDTFENRFAINHWPARVFGSMFAIFGGVALLLAGIGLYGVTSYAVSQRSHEIGVRMALGASGRRILSEMLGGGLRQVLIGLVMGLGGAAVLTRLLEAQLVDVRPNDPVTFAAVTAILVTIGVMGCLIPARRALRVNPVDALRHE